MKNILTIIAMLFASISFAQSAPQPDDKDLYFLTIVTHADYEKRPDEQALVNAVRTDPLKSLAIKCRFNHYTTGEKLYEERYSKLYPESSLPVIVLQRPDGGYIYKASGPNIPRGARAIVTEMKMYKSLIPGNRDSVEEFQTDDQEDEERRPRIIQPRDEDVDLPDTMDIFGKTPIRDSIAGGVTMFYLLVAVGFMGVAGIAALTTLIVMAWLIKN